MIKMRSSGVAHVFSKKKRAENFIEKKNKKARKYVWKIKPYYQGYVAYKVPDVRLKPWQPTKRRK